MTNSESNANPQDLQIRQVGLKVTAPRVKILQILQAHPNSHVSAEDVYRMLLDKGEDIGISTVYRVLTQFESAGLVQRHHFETGNAVFELHTGSHHDHILCLQCGAVEEFVDAAIEARQHEIARQAGFRIRDHALTLYCDCIRPNCPNRT